MRKGRWPDSGHGVVSRLRDIALGVTLAALCAWNALGQNTSSGTVSGQVVDAQGAAIPSAEVRLLDKATGALKTSLTNETGRYSIFNLNPGEYDVSFSKQGFSEAKLTGQRVAVGLVLTLNVTLPLGTSSTVVEVTSTAGAELQTTNATVGTTSSGVQLDN